MTFAGIPGNPKNRNEGNKDIRNSRESKGKKAPPSLTSPKSSG